MYELGNAWPFCRICEQCKRLKCRRLVTRRRLCKGDKNGNQRMRTPNNYFILNMACADGLLQSVYAVSVSTVDTAYSHQYLPVAYHGSRRRAALPFVSVYWSNVSVHCKFACDCLGSLFPGVLSTQENNNNSYRPVSDWRQFGFLP